MTFERAWQAFADQEAQRRAPAELAARVDQAITAGEQRSSRRPALVIGAVGLAASVLVAAAWSIPQSSRRVVATTAPLNAHVTRPLVPYAASIVRDTPRIVSASAKPQPIPRSGGLALRGATVAVAVAPETLQLVRLRMPRQALAAFGLLLVDPDTTGVVDVDVLVGEDGLPRHIRKVWFEP